MRSCVPVKVLRTDNSIVDGKARKWITALIETYSLIIEILVKSSVMALLCHNDQQVREFSFILLITISQSVLPIGNYIVFSSYLVERFHDRFETMSPFNLFCKYLCELTI